MTVQEYLESQNIQEMPKVTLMSGVELPPEEALNRLIFMAMHEDEQLTKIIVV